MSFYGIAIDPRDMEAMSPAMMRQRQIEQTVLATQYRPTLSDLNALANYRPTTFVPNTWADWSASDWAP